MAKVVLKFETNDANGKKLEIDDGSIVSLNSLSQSSSDSSSINYGCIANTGSMTIVDFNGNIAKQIKDGTMPSSNVDVDLYVNNNKIQSHITTDSTYDANTNEFNVSVTNRIADWDILKYKGYIYRDKSATLYEILADVFSVVSDSLDDALSETIIYTYPEDGSYISKQGTIKEYLQLISVEYPSIEYGYTIRQIIDDICTIAQLQCFIDDNDKIKFVSARPISNEEDVPIVIDKSIILGDVDSDLFIRNKYDGVELSEKLVNDIVDYASALTQEDIFVESLEQLQSETYIESNYNYEGKYSSLTYIEILAYYYNGTIVLKKKQNQNLEQILVVFNDIIRNDSYTYSNYYDLYTAPISGVGNPSSGMKVSVKNIVIKNYAGEYDYDRTGTIDINDSHSFLYNGVESLAELKSNNKSKIESVIDNGDTISIKFKILCGKNIYRLGGGATTSETADPVDVPMEGTYEKYIPHYGNNVKTADITLYGNKRIISFEDSSTEDNASYAKTKVSVSSNSSLLQNKTEISNKKISDIIKHNILTDYKNGLSTAKLKIICSDMYDDNGELVKNWQLGKILENNNLVQLGEKVMRINSRNFIYDGSPEIELQTLEQKIIFFYGLFKDGDGVYSWNQLIDSGKIQIFETSDNKIETMAGTDTSLDGDLILPLNVTIIGYKTFSNCNLLTSVTIPYGVKTVSEQAFSDCSSLKKINIPESVTYIGDATFSGCSSLKEVVIPDSVVTLGSTLFYECSSLEKVILPSGETDILSDMFSKCSNLQYVKIPDTLTNIWYASFQQCTSLKHIFIPKSVTTIEALQFNAYNAPFYGSPNVVIYCEASSQQSGWQQYWNTYNRVYNQNTDEYDYLYLTVKYGYTREQYEAEVGLS